MFETISIGTSGLLAHAKGLRVIGNNLANVNTPGFKSSQLQFAALFDQNGGQGAQPRLGYGVQTGAVKLNFNAGVDQNTGNPLDLNIDGDEFFVVKRDGQLLYTRNGDFRFDQQDVLVNAAGDRVQGRNAQGELADITLDSIARSQPKATAVIALAGNLTSTVASPPVDAAANGLTLIDPNGGSHTVNLTFSNLGSGNFKVTVADAAAPATPLGTGNIKFIGGFPDAANNSVTFNYSASGVAPFAVKLDFSKNVTSLVTATTLSMSSQDGYAPGVITDQGIAGDGTVTVRYSNNQVAKGPRLAMAQFRTLDGLVEKGAGMFGAAAQEPVQYGFAGADGFGLLAAGHREGSNVDLAAEFGNLILMQRGYQASSHVISTANDMIQQLFDMKR